MNKPDPHGFAKRWIAAWNAHDVETVLADYADDVQFTSPTAERVVPQSQGVVRGKPALREYWTRALEGNSELHFTLVEVYEGVDTIVLRYRNQADALICEVLTFREGLVVSGHATHLHA